MAALPKVREIETILRSAQQDPRLISIVCGIAERLRVQHEQMMAVVTEFNKMQDLLIELMKKMGIRDENLKRLGVEEMMKRTAGEVVRSVDTSDDDPRSTHEMGRETRKN